MGPREGSLSRTLAVSHLSGEARRARAVEQVRARHACSIGEYVRRLRVDYAARRLVGSTSSIADIATAVGFADQSHFSRVFLRITGLSPGR